MRAHPVVATVALAVTLAACGSAGATPAAPSSATKVPVAGYVDVPGQTWVSGAAAGDDCTAQSGYDDVAAGAQIVLATDTGATLATASLTGGKFAPGTAAKPGTVTATQGRCQLPFDFGQVDLGAGKFFSITLGHRGTLKYGRADLDKPVQLRIG